MGLSERVSSKFRERGLRMTPQREAIIRYLDGHTGHPSAEQIHRAVRESQPNLSFMTVYQTLHTLKEVGEVRELFMDGARKRFDPNPEPHHHVICRGCGRIDDLTGRAARTIQPPASVARRYRITGHHVEFYGFCPMCRGRGTRDDTRGSNHGS